MVVVFGSFLVLRRPSLKEIGLGLAVAIAIDATIVRVVLVPATMELLGRANWWLPGWLERLLPPVRAEGSTLPPVAAAPSEDAEAGDRDRVGDPRYRRSPVEVPMRFRGRS